MHIWQKLEKCPFDNYLVVVILEKQILGFVAEYVFCKPIFPFGEILSMCMQIKAQYGSLEIFTAKNIGLTLFWAI